MLSAALSTLGVRSIDRAPDRSKQGYSSRDLTKIKLDLGQMKSRLPWIKRDL
jgi:hypothetical protein